MKKTKYGNRKITTPDGTFDSKKEYERWLLLKFREKNGEIHSLRRQITLQVSPRVTEEYIVHGKRKDIVKEKILIRGHVYTCDFFYEENGQLIIEEVKSAATKTRADYTLRRDLIKKRLYDKNKVLGQERFVFREIV